MMHTHLWVEALQVHRRICIAAMAASSSTGKLMTKKTEMCKFHEQGKCERKLYCRFAHSDEELGDVVVDWQMMGCKLTMCKYWEQDRCRNTDDNCEYAHGEEQQSVPMKYEKQKGKTEWGNTWWTTTKWGSTWQYPAELVNMECNIIGIVYVCLQCYF